MPDFEERVERQEKEFQEQWSKLGWFTRLLLSKAFDTIERECGVKQVEKFRAERKTEAKPC